MKTKTIMSALIGCVFSLLTFAAQAQVCSVGDSADVLWKGKWYSASVTRVNETQTRCFIHYTGYDSNWDEWVGGDRIRVRAQAASFRVGDPVQVKWKGQWYPASVLKVDSGQFRIHYDGYDNSWDEWVGTNRIRPR